LKIIAQNIVCYATIRMFAPFGKFY